MLFCLITDPAIPVFRHSVSVETGLCSKEMHFFVVNIFVLLGGSPLSSVLKFASTNRPVSFYFIIGRKETTDLSLESYPWSAAVKSRVMQIHIILSMQN